MTADMCQLCGEIYNRDVLISVKIKSKTLNLCPECLSDFRDEYIPKSVLQDIKAEIAQVCAYSINYPNWEYAKGLQKAIEIIDKYKAESEE